jgi:hypothetical protein
MKASTLGLGPDMEIVSPWVYLCKIFSKMVKMKKLHLHPAPVAVAKSYCSLSTPFLVDLSLSESTCESNQN